MVLDANLALLSNDAFVLTSNGFSTNGTDINIGRTGLHRNAAVTTIVQGASTDRTLTFNIYLSLNNSAFRQIGAINYAPNAAGKQSMALSEAIPWQEWTDSKIMLRVNVTATNGSSNNYQKVRCYVGVLDGTNYGRIPNAADAVVDA